jgi:Flp pilus assembly protein TadD
MSEEIHHEFRGGGDCQKTSHGPSLHSKFFAANLILRPGHPEANLLIGDIFAGRENNEEAVRAYRDVDPDAPLGWQARLRAAEALHAAERKEEAFELLRAMADERTDRTEPLVTLGNLLRRDQDYAEAEVAYSRALERIDGLERRYWPLLYSRGITYERTDRWPQAEADFLQALELEPEQPFVLNYLGYSWVEQGTNLEEAQEMLRRAVALRPNDGFIVDSLGWVYYRLGKYEAAIEHLEQAVELEPGDPVINDHLGDAYWKVGREREARFQWRRALSLDPEEEDAAAIEEKLEHGLRDESRTL